MKVIVIGAGPAGLMCSYKLREKGHEVVLIDKNEKVGKKIYVTGKGRCNVTNDCSFNDFFSNVKTNPKFLYSAFSNFNSQDTMAFFENNNVPLVVERGNRVFPSSYRAGDIAQALYTANKNIGVNIKLNEMVTRVYQNKESFVVETTKNIYSADKVVIATGGMSYQYTGSTGDGYKFASNFGHEIIKPVPSLCLIRIKEVIDEKMLKFTMKNVTLRIKVGKEKFEEFGELTFFKEGLGGPISLTLSCYLNRIQSNDTEIEIDFKPALSNEKLDARLIREIQNNTNQTVEDLLKTLLPSEILPWFIKNAKIDSNASLCSLKHEVREHILASLKGLRLTFNGLDDIDRAVVTSGGISVKEINPKTMESKIVKGLYFAGEIIDVDAFTGGFNLQIAFSTGALIANSFED